MCVRVCVCVYVCNHLWVCKCLYGLYQSVRKDSIFETKDHPHVQYSPVINTLKNQVTLIAVCSQEVPQWNGLNRDQGFGNGSCCSLPRREGKCSVSMASPGLFVSSGNGREEEEGHCILTPCSFVRPGWRMSLTSTSIHKQAEKGANGSLIFDHFQAKYHFHCCVEPINKRLSNRLKCIRLTGGDIIRSNQIANLCECRRNQINDQQSLLSWTPFPHSFSLI